MSFSGPSAPVVQCRRCGAALTVNVNDPTARCGACGAGASEFLVDRGPGFASEIEDARLVERFETSRGRSIAERTRSNLSATWLVGVLMLSIYWALDLAATTVGPQRGLFDMVILGTTILVVNRCVRSIVARRATGVDLEPETPMSAMTRCSACGADVLFQSDAPQARCSFCGATLVEPSIIERGRAERARRRALAAELQADSLESGGDGPPEEPSVTLLDAAVALLAAVFGLAIYGLSGPTHLLSTQLLAFSLLVAVSIGVGAAALVPKSASSG